MISKEAFFVGGLGFGDEGKGSIIDFLTRKYNVHTIVRYNGGSQALHHVVTPNGVVHGFSQFGSGTFVRGVQTYLSRFMVVNPLYLAGESSDLDQVGLNYSSKRITIDRRCVIITPFHRILNQMQEISRGDKRHGSCGHGIGQAIEDWNKMGTDTLMAGDMMDRLTLRRKLKYLFALKLDLAEQLFEEYQDPYILDPDVRMALKMRLVELKLDINLERLVQQYCNLFHFGYFKLGDDETLKRLLNKDGRVIFEGAQGVLLDPQFGTPPYVTKTKTTFENADELLKEANYTGKVTKIGVLRTYATRHGNGPFVTEDRRLTDLLPEKHNRDNKWQGKFRVGHFDIVGAKYAIESIGRVDEIAFTNLDRLIGIKPLKICTAYDSSEKPIYEKLKSLNSIADLVQHARRIVSLLDVPVKILSLGPTFQDKQVFEPYYNKK